MVAEHTIRCAVIGASYGAKHVENLIARSNVEVVALCARTMASAVAVGKRYGIGVVTDQIDDIFRLDLDAICVAAPTYLHHPITHRAINKGWHVLCEKPLALTVAEGESMLAAADGAGVVHAINYDYRNLPNMQRFHSLLQQGHVGEPYQAHFLWMSEYNGDRTIAANWRHVRAEAGFGTLGDMSHMLDDVLWHFGPIDRICADLQTVVPFRPSADGGAPKPNEVEDSVAFVAVARSGLQICGHLSRCAPGAGYRSMECYGSEGVLRLIMPDDENRWETRLTCMRPGREAEDLSLPTTKGLVETTQDRFLGAIRGTTTVLTSFHEGVAVLRLVEAMRASSSSATWVRPAEAETPQEQPHTSI